LSADPAPPSRAAPEIHYGPGGDLERIDIALIREAVKQIDMTAYILTDTAVIEALREASARGVNDNQRCEFVHRRSNFAKMIP
jgi:phosphatidylserine/phosphatidylglycerophosphate/cardiolipin synthase-like enzyme